MNKRKAVISLAGYEDIFEDSMENGEREEVVRLPISQFIRFGTILFVCWTMKKWRNSKECQAIWHSDAGNRPSA